MKIAVLGAGTMGTTYVRNLAGMEDVRLVGVFDASREAAERAAALGSTRGFTDLDEMLRQTDPDLVCVCLPTFLHKEYVLKLAAAGKDIICEKPLALSVEDAEEMEAACAKAGVRLYVAHVLRFFPNYADLKQRVDSGLVGAVKVARAKRYSSFPRGSGNWFADHAKSGGVILDLMIHDFDFMRWTIGEVASVYTLYREAEGKQIAYVTMKFDSGAIAQVSGFWGYSGPFTTFVELACEKGVLRLDNQARKSLELFQDQAAVQESERVQVPSLPTLRDPYYYELRHFIECRRKGTEPLITVGDAKQAVAIALAAIESGRRNEPVEVPRIANKGVLA